MLNISPSLDLFLKKFKNRENQIIWKSIKSDLDTPVSAYLKLCRNKENTFLLESVQDGTYRGRYSIIGSEPDLIWKCNNGIAYIKKIINNKNSDFIEQKDSPLISLKKIINNSKINIPKNLPPMASGLIGYLSYETIELYETLPKRKKKPIPVPDGFFIRPTVMAIFDSIKNEVLFASPCWYEKNINPKKKYMDLVNKISTCMNDLSKNNLTSNNNKKYLYKKPTSNLSRTSFFSMINKAKKYIFEGDIFQVVLSQRFKTRFMLPPFELYRSLRSLNPSPFLFYMNFKDDKQSSFSLIGSSPEILVKLENKVVTIRPIAGTRVRGKNAKEDMDLKKDLLSDPKELAEHLMLLDLGRNDVGKI